MLMWPKQIVASCWNELMRGKKLMTTSLQQLSTHAQLVLF